MGQGRNSNSDAADMGDVNGMLQDSLSKSIDAMGRHQYKKGEETTKLFGLIEMDAGFAEGINLLYTTFGNQISHLLSPRVYNTTRKFAPHAKVLLGRALSEKELNRTAAGVTLGVNLSVFLLPSVTQFVKDLQSQHDARIEFAHQLAPVLDEVYGSHSVSTVMGITAEGKGQRPGNSVIYAHRRRMNKENMNGNINTLLSAVGRNFLNVVGEGMNFEALVSGANRVDIVNMHQAENATRHRADFQKYSEDKRLNWSPAYIERKVSEKVESEKGKEGQIAFLGGNAVLTKLVDSFTKSSKNRQENTRQPYSAWEMISSLQQQLQNNPGKASRFALPGRRGAELPLDRYVKEIFDQHQRELADFDPKQAEIRDALKGDLEAIGKAIADRITAGDLDPILLVRLVGEGEIVRNKGRGLASVDEVNTLIERFASTARRTTAADPHEYIAQRNFDIEQLGECLKALSGDERLEFAASFPDSVLKAAHFPEKDIKSVQEVRAQAGYDLYLAQTVLGMEAESEDTLRRAGLGQTQLKKLHQAAEKIGQEGEKAIPPLKTSATNADGIEQMIADFAVPTVLGDKTYLGKLRQTGRDALEASRDDREKSHAEKHGKHAREKAFAPDDREERFAERETRRHENSEHEHASRH